MHRARPVGAQSVEYYSTDAIGSVRLLTSETGAVLERRDYLPFGEACTTDLCAGNPVPAGSQRLGFAGKERDTETGLDYFGARYHSSAIGRFRTTDPVQTLRENLTDPQRWNRHAYVRNNPLAYVDPTGAVLELTGDDKDAALDRIKGIAGPAAGSLLYTTESGGRTYVRYRGSARDFRKAGGEIGWCLQSIIDQTDRTVQFAVADSFETRNGHFTTAAFGGAATVGAEESITGHTQMFASRNAGTIADRTLGQTILGASRATTDAPSGTTTRSSPCTSSATRGPMRCGT